MHIVERVLNAFESGRFKWGQGGFGQFPPPGRCCLATAAGNLGNGEDYVVFTQALGFHFDEDIGAKEMVGWNDLPSTKYEDVLNLLRTSLAKVKK